MILHFKYFLYILHLSSFVITVIHEQESTRRRKGFVRSILLSFSLASFP